MKSKNRQIHHSRKLIWNKGNGMEDKIIEYAMRWESIMKVHANGFTIRDMKTRWGSCSIHSKKIRMNLQLAVKSEECVEYVLVHELCHLLEPSHNQRFYDLMSHFLPDWRERKQKLNEKV